MNKDGHFTQVHLQRGRDADLFDDFTHDRLPADEVYVPPHHQPVNPEDEDDVVPDQHAAFGIARATQARREPAWRDLGLAHLMGRGPLPGAGGPGLAALPATAAGAAGRGVPVPGSKRPGTQLPR